MNNYSDKRLCRSKSDKKLFGVCGGLGEYFHLDPVIFRLGFVIFVLAGTVGVWVYLAMALIMPVNRDETVVTDVKKLRRSKKDKKLCGVCGGIAEYFQMDSTVLRVIFLVLVLVFGIGLLAYGVAAICLPYGDEN